MAGLMFPKDAPGTFKRERHDKKHAEDLQLDANKRKAKQRDGQKCRWPHKCHKADRLESAHIVDASLGGSIETSNLITVCLPVHQGPGSIHQKDKEVRPLTSSGADGACEFYERDEAGRWVCVGTERLIGVSTTRSVRA